MDEQRILANVTNLTAEQLFDSIKKGIVTLDKLMATGFLDANKRKKIAELQIQLDTNDDAAWERARYGNESTLRDYITSFPSGRHVQEAKDNIQALEIARGQARAEKERILNRLKRNYNSYDPSQIFDYLQNNTITKEELQDCGIPGYIIDNINNIHPIPLQLGQTPRSIPDGYTEVYFWGIPGSGKTCALGSILNSAERQGLLKFAIGPGYNYMTMLKNIFFDKNPILPPPSPVETTQYLPFTLRKTTEKNARSVSLIELSGEIFQCFFYKHAGGQFPSQSHKETFDTLIHFLSGNNRKIHFFFIDYAKDNVVDSENKTQSDYLAAASLFFEKPEYKIFGKTTDAIYLILTKSDLMPCSKEERFLEAKKHLNQHFPSFINSLKKQCELYGINGGKLLYEPFSLGKVYFQQICDFDNSTAINILDILMERIPSSKKSLLDIFNK